jgi:hypothetical protein
VIGPVFVMRVRTPSPEAAAAAPPFDGSANPSIAGAGAGAAPPSSFAGVLRSFVHDLDRGQTAVHTLIRSASGGDLDAGELIALQAGAYRYSEAIDVASRLVDRATGAIKTVLQAGGQ